MKVAIHQPNFFPWLGYFNKIHNADVFVFLDDAEYTKNSYINRSKIVYNKLKVDWITLPIQYSGYSNAPIKEIRINNWNHARIKIAKTIKQSYGKHPFFEEFYPTINSILSEDFVHISELNMRIIKQVCGFLRTSAIFYVASELGATGTGTTRLVEICRLLSADTYICGAGSLNYQDDSMFAEHGIKLIKLTSPGLVYSQLNTQNFFPGLSILDALFNEGIRTRSLLS